MEHRDAWQEEKEEEVVVVGVGRGRRPVKANQIGVELKSRSQGA